MPSNNEDVTSKASDAYKELRRLHDAMKESDDFEAYSHIISNIESLVYTFYVRGEEGEFEETDDMISLDEHTQKNLRQLANLCIDMQHHEYIAPTPFAAKQDIIEYSPDELTEQMFYRNLITRSIFTWILSHPHHAITYFEIEKHTELREFTEEYVSYYLQQLEEKGLIDRCVEERNGNSVTFYTLTDTGFEAAESVGVVGTAGFMYRLSNSVDFGERWEIYRNYERPMYSYKWMETPLID